MPSRLTQSSPSFIILRIDIRTSSQVLVDCFDVSGTGSFVKIRRLTTPHQCHHRTYQEELFHAIEANDWANSRQGVKGGLAF